MNNQLISNLENDIIDTEQFLKVKNFYDDYVFNKFLKNYEFIEMLKNDKENFYKNRKLLSDDNNYENLIINNIIKLINDFYNILPSIGILLTLNYITNNHQEINNFYNLISEFNYKIFINLEEHDNEFLLIFKKIIINNYEPIQKINNLNIIKNIKITDLFLHHIYFCCKKVFNNNFVLMLNDIEFTIGKCEQPSCRFCNNVKNNNIYKISNTDGTFSHNVCYDIFKTIHRACKFSPALYKGYVYVLYDETTNYYKIGITKDLQRRFKELSTPTNVRKFLYYYFSNNPEYDEKFLHKHFKGKCLSNEWFNLSESDLRMIDEYFY